MIFTVDEREQGLTVAEFLHLRIPAAPPAYLKQLIKKGKITRVGQPLATHDCLSPGEEILLPNSSRLQQLLATACPALNECTVLFESREILAVEKPAGLAVHSSQGHEGDNLTDRIAEMLGRRGDRYRVAPVHRLDLETSGPVLFGKGKKACSELGKMFMRHEVEKHYLAMVVGRTRGSGVIKSELAVKGKQKEALTEFKARGRYDHFSLIELRLVTGRQHQIRRQLAELGHPIFGDSRYGGPCPDDLSRMFLHCRFLSFVDPFSGAQLDIASELPVELSKFSLFQRVVSSQKSICRSDK